jgi:hypothetical protein
MRKEFESELAKQVSGKKRSSKAWIVVALCAAVLVSGAVAVTAVTAADQIKDKVQDQLKDGTGDNCDSDGICDSDCDGVCDSDCDGVCDCSEDCTCVDCPCCA